MSEIKKLALFLGMMTLCAGVRAQGNTVVRGEVSPGVYTNVAVTSDGYLRTSGTTSAVTTQAVLLAAASSTSTRSTGVLVNTDYVGVSIVCNVTAVTALQNITLTLQYLDIASNAVTVIDSASITATGVYRLEAGRGVSLVNNTQIGINLPNRWRLLVLHSGAGNFTYGCDYSLSR